MGLGGLEPPTSRLSGVRSNHLSYRPETLLTELVGGARRIRTDDPLRAKQVLSQLSYSPVYRPPDNPLKRRPNQSGLSDPMVDQHVCERMRSWRTQTRLKANAVRFWIGHT